MSKRTLQNAFLVKLRKAINTECLKMFNKKTAHCDRQKGSKCRTFYTCNFNCRKRRHFCTIWLRVRKSSHSHIHLLDKLLVVHRSAVHCTVKKDVTGPELTANLKQKRRDVGIMPHSRCIYLSHSSEPIDDFIWFMNEKQVRVGVCVKYSERSSSHSREGTSRRFESLVHYAAFHWPVHEIIAVLSRCTGYRYSYNRRTYHTIRWRFREDDAFVFQQDRVPTGTLCSRLRHT